MSRLRDWRWRKPITAVVLGFLIFSGITLGDTNQTSGQPAQAGYCIEEAGGWNLKGGTASNLPTVAKVQFGATICMDGGKITSVSPFLSGGVEGAGRGVGYNWENQGARVTVQNDRYTEVVGTAKSNICYGIGKIEACSLTTTETYRLRFYSQHGPYIGPQPGITGTYRWCSLTGCTSGNLVQRAY